MAEASDLVGFGLNVNEAIKANNSANASRLADGFLMSPLSTELKTSVAIRDVRCSGSSELSVAKMTQNTSV